MAYGKESYHGNMSGKNSKGGNPRGSNTGKSFGDGKKARGNSRTRQVDDRYK